MVGFACQQAKPGDGPEYEPPTGGKEVEKMQVLLMGLRTLDFESNGDQIKGMQLFVAYPEDGVEGQMTDKIFLRDGFELPDGLKPGMNLDVTFNRRGRPEKVVAAPATQRLTLNK